MRITVFGGAGFVGSNLTAYLLKEYNDVEIFVADNLSTGRASNLNGLYTYPNFELCVCDIHDEELVETLVGTSDYVINCISVPRNCYTNIGRAIDMTTRGVGAILTYLPEESLYVHISDSALYDSYDIYPSREDSAINPRTVAAAIYHSSEQLIMGYVNERGSRACILRPTILFGRNDHEYNLMGFLFNHVISSTDIAIDDFETEITYIDDFSAAVVNMIDAPYIGILNIGSGYRTSIRNIISRIAEAIGSKSNVQYNKLRARYGVTSEAAYNTIGWKAKANIEDLLAETAKWYKDQL